MLRSKLLIAALAALALIIAGCQPSAPDTAGSDDGDSAQTPEDSTATSDDASEPADSGDGEVTKLGFITKFPVDFFIVMEDAVKAWDAEHDDVEVIFGTGADAADSAGQIELIESMVAQGVKGIAVTPAGEEVIPALQAAVDEGVKIVLVDNDLPTWDGKSALVATDNFQGGKLAGEWLATQLEPGSTLAILEGVPGVPSLDDRVNGMLEGLGELDVEVVGRAPTNCAQDLGVSGAEDLLTANPEVDAIYAACGPPTVGALQAIKNAGIAPDDIILVGFDAQAEEVAAIIAGEQDATVAQFPPKMGELGIETLYQVLNGESVEAFVDTGTALVSKDNADQF
ncbi:MAG TPA: sugar ABC transporter substrate-binding protein [Egibacteraceae bacterium]|nr:sugar ABC transporter substrate-binding protein [Egibacteraceae bacterium]